MQSSALALSGWIYARAHAPITHLKLQKLVFYTYGAALAFGLDDQIGPITFEAWTHGPVNRELWQQLREYKSDPIPAGVLAATSYNSPVERCIGDALEVYDALSAWALRCESHLEQPWKDARASRTHAIDPVTLRSHFEAKFGGGRVAWPAHLVGSSSFALDGVPLGVFPTLGALADAVRKTAA